MYYDSTRPFVELASRDFGSYLQVLFSDNTPETKSLFTSDTGVPYSYMYYDNKTCMVLRMTSIFRTSNLLKSSSTSFKRPSDQSSYT